MFYNSVIIELVEKKSLKILFNSSCDLLLNRGIEDMNSKMLLLLMLITISIFPNVITVSTAQEEKEQQQPTGSDNSKNDLPAADGTSKPIVHVKIEGTETNDKIKGGNGNDVINGNIGDDTLNGGEGDDKLSVDFIRMLRSA